MIEIKNREIEKEPKGHRRLGGAFDTLARFLTSIEKATFKNGTVIADRPGDSSISGINAPSVFEIYQQKDPPTNTFNLSYWGRKGKGTFNNTNYLELTVNSKTNSALSLANGVFQLRMREDGVVKNSSYTFVNLDAHSTLSSLGSGIRHFISGGEGTAGGVQISYINDSGAVVYAIAVDGDGIQMSGLPTSSVGLATGAIWNDSGTLKIV